MKRDFYIENRPAMARWPRRLLIFLMAAVLLASVSYALYVKASRATISDTWQQFESSMGEGQYEQALVLLRGVQARVADWDAEDDSVEAVVTGRTQAIMRTVEQAGRSLTDDDRAFLTGMEEQTGMPVSAHLRSLCVGFLTGTGSRAQVDAAFQALAFMPNLSAPTRSLQHELDTIGQYTVAVQEAESIFSASDTEANHYFSALSHFNDIAGMSDGFVQTYALARAQDCKDKMLDPLVADARLLLAADRYYSAHDLLERLQAIFPENQQVSALRFQAASHTAAALELYTEPIEHISVRPLIVTPSRAFDGDENANAIAQSMLTVQEFRALLMGLYERDFILIDPHNMLDETGMPADIRVPFGKKPLILTIETVNYYAHRAANGLCSNLLLDADGNVCGQYLDAEGVLRIDREAEAVGVLECFIEDHPDFSFDGAKGTLSITGYECVFGMVCNSDQLRVRNINNAESGLAIQRMDESQYETNREAVRAIAERLKEKGWCFASSTYDYLQTGAAETTLEMVIQDQEKWLEQIQPLVGQIDILHYPNGSMLNGDDPRCMAYRDQGYRYFTGLGPSAYVYYRENYVYMDKVAIHGYALDHADLSRFFDAGAARDLARP